MYEKKCGSKSPKLSFVVEKPATCSCNKNCEHEQYFDIDSGQYNWQPFAGTVLASSQIADKYLYLSKNTNWRLFSYVLSSNLSQFHPPVSHIRLPRASLDHATIFADYHIWHTIPFPYYVLLVLYQFMISYLKSWWHKQKNSTQMKRKI